MESITLGGAVGSRGNVSTKGPRKGSFCVCVCVYRGNVTLSRILIVDMIAWIYTCVKIRASVYTLSPWKKMHNVRVVG